MKKQLQCGLALLLFFATVVLHAQSVAFNNSGAKGDPSAIVDMSNNPNLGFLMPAVTFTSSIDVTTIPSPAMGLIVYNPTTSTSNGLFGAGFYYWSGSQWLFLTNSGTPVISSIAMTVPSIFNISGSPITSSGTFGVTLSNQNANTAFAGPASGSPATPAFRSLITADLPAGIPNANLANSNITVIGANGVTITGSPVSLGGSITVSSPGSLISISGASESPSNTSVGGSGLYFSSNPITSTGSIGLAALSPSPAGTYGSATLMPQITVNAEGQITSASTAAMPGGGSVTSIGASSTTGTQSGTSGLYFSSGSPITSTGNLAIATGGVTNSMLANPSITINTTAPVSGGGSVNLGGTTTVGLSTPLAISNGGTGIVTAPTQYGVAYAASTTTYSTTAAGTTGSVLTSNGTSAPTFQTASSLAGNGYIQNNATSTPQTANYYVQSAAAGNAPAVIEGASGQTADLLDLKNAAGTVIAGIDKSGNLTTQGLASTGTVNINTTGAGITTIGAGTNTSTVIIGNTTGNVGIGTTTPNALLNVNGTMGLGTASATTGTATFYNSANTGSVSLQAGTTTTSYTLTLPTAQGAANTVLTDNTSGTLSWSSPSAALTNVNNGLTLTGNNVQLGGALVQATDVAGSSYPMVFDLGTGSAAGTSNFSVTNGGSANPYLYATGNTTNNVPNISIGNSVPGSNLLNVSTSTAAASGAGKGISLTAQMGASGSTGGTVNIAGGMGGSGAQGGNVSIMAGSPTGTANGSNILLTTGAKSGSGSTNGGVAVNNTGAVPDASALVDMATNTTGPAGGLLMPRLPSDPGTTVEGMVYFNITSNCFRFYSASLPGWQNLVCPCTTPPSAPASVNGPSSVCVNSNYVFSISPVTNASSYLWTVPAGAIITSGQGKTTINVTMPSSAGSGSISVSAVNGCGYSGVTSLTITIGSSPTGTGIISGNNLVCPSTSQSYSISGVTGATYYIWTVPTGATLVGGQGTASINITTGSTGGNITCTPYSAAGGCPGTVVIYSVSITPPPSAVGTISGPISGCSTSTFVSTAKTYSIAPVSGATSYSWSVNNTYATVTASTTNTCTITSAATAGTFTITATAINCGGSTSNTLVVTSYPHSTLTYTYVTTATQSWSVPCYVPQATVQLWGAGGGSGDYTSGTGYVLSGGSGAYMTGVLSGIAGQTLTLTVPSGGIFSTATVGGAGGWPGGGLGGNDYTYGEYGGGGGGYAAVQIGGTYYALAGGGGGGGIWPGYLGYGGGGGATTGGPGGIGEAGAAATGGTVTTFGLGGTGGTVAGGNGAAFTGGIGAVGQPSGYYAGGGGGSGYYGGGGGNDYGQGGAGGSSYPAANIVGSPGFTITSNLAGNFNNAAATATAPGSPPAGIGAGGYLANGGNGEIIITY